MSSHQPVLPYFTLFINFDAKENNHGLFNEEHRSQPRVPCQLGVSAIALPLVEVSVAVHVCSMIVWLSMPPELLFLSVTRVHAAAASPHHHSQNYLTG